MTGGTPASVNGGAAGLAMDAGVSRGNGGTVGTPTGGNGNFPTMVWLPGSAAGGGYGNAAGNAGGGGAGAQCGGGGGGGSALNGSTAGNSGKGGDGYAFVWELR